MAPTAAFISAGHGLTPQHGIDNGATGSGTTERAQTVALASALVKMLQPLPLEIIPVGIENRMSLPDKIAFINQRCADLGLNSTTAVLVEIHLNAGPSAARGVEAIYGTRKQQDLHLAET